MLCVVIAFALVGCPSTDKPADTAAVADLDGDGYAAPEDCDDERVTVNPGEPETPFNGRDDDCDETTLDEDGDGDGAILDDDCNDSDAAIFPGATELCNEQDDNCDGHVDEGVASTYFADTDGDGFGNTAVSATLCEQSAGYVLNASDCDDSAPEVYPGAPETCDGRDEDCDGIADNGVGTEQFADNDGDGFGDPTLSLTACDPIAGYTTDDHDCDDARADIFPGANEVCDGSDQDCDGRIDEGVTGTFYEDSDGDGHGNPAVTTEACSGGTFVSSSDDCDDGNSAVFPGADEFCDGVDNDCDGGIDPDSSLDAGTYARDADGDGYGDPALNTRSCSVPTGYCADTTDCDDAVAAVHPGATEVCNGVDDDCDGTVDPPTSSGAATWFADSDGDGFGDATTTQIACDIPVGYLLDDSDCDDGDATVHPGSDEYCNGKDDDCDGIIDPADSLDASDWYADDDGDGFGDPELSETSCDALVGFLADNADCDDTSAAVSPDGVESCNGVDDDCDGITDPSTSTDARTWYADADSDGYGFDASTQSACTQPTGHAAVAGDCNDLNPAIYPTATEVCNAADDDCDGVTDESDAADAEVWYADADGDTFGDPDATASACFSPPTGYVSDNSDCYDASADAYPDSHEIELPGDGIDTDCDGLDACTDLTCDGYPDLVFGQHYDGDYVLDSYSYAQSSGTYASTGRTSFGTTGVHDTKVEDIDGDGYQDILFANYFNGSSTQINAYIYWGSAAGYSATDRTSLPTIGSIHAEISDIDADGYKDIVFANHYTGSSYSTNSYVYWGSAAGFSTTDRTSLATYGARHVLVNDLDEDGYSDIVFCNYYSGSTYSTDSYIYWGSSAGYSSSDRTSLATIGCFDADIGDMNGDGYKDIAFADYFNGSVYAVNSYVYYGSATGYSSSSRVSLATSGTIGVDVADFNNDGLDDVAFGGHFNAAWTTTAPSYVYWGATSGLSSSSVTSLASTTGVRDPVSGDLNSDGYLDLVLPRFYSGSSYTVNSYIYWGASSGFSETNRTSLGGYGVASAAVGDLDADGYPEVVLGSFYSGSSYTTTSYVYWGSSAGYSSTDRTGITTIGVIPAPVLAGVIEW